VTRSIATLGGFHSPKGDTNVPSSVTVENSKRELVVSPPLTSGQMHFSSAVFQITSVFKRERSYPARPGFRDSGSVIGVNVLERYGAVINCRTQQLFFSIVAGSLGMSRAKYEEMGLQYAPLLVSHGLVEVVGSVGQKTYSFVVDTGAFATILTPSVLQDSGVPYKESVGVLKGPLHDFKGARISNADLPNFRIGEIPIEKTLVGFADLNLHERLSHPLGGVIGADLLFFHSAIIDLGGLGLYLRPDSRASR
jgi:hypothetical protein